MTREILTDMWNSYKHRNSFRAAWCLVAALPRTFSFVQTPVDSQVVGGYVPAMGDPGRPAGCLVPIVCWHTLMQGGMWWWVHESRVHDWSPGAEMEEDATPASLDDGDVGGIGLV